MLWRLLSVSRRLSSQAVFVIHKGVRISCRDFLMKIELTPSVMYCYLNRSVPSCNSITSLIVAGRKRSGICTAWFRGTLVPAASTLGADQAVAGTIPASSA